MKRIGGLLAPFALLYFAACGGGSSSPTDPAGVSPFQVESQLTSLVNQARAAEGVLPELTQDQLIAQVARAHSAAMRDQGFFSHVDPDGKRLRDRLRAAGISFRSAGENLAQVVGSSDPAGDAHRMLMGSPSHRENIFGEDYESIGVGVARRDSTYWITEIFVEP